MSYTDFNLKTEYYTYYESQNAKIKDKLESVTDANGHRVFKNEYEDNRRFKRQYDANNNVMTQDYKDVVRNEETGEVIGNEIMAVSWGENTFWLTTFFDFRILFHSSIKKVTVSSNVLCNPSYYKIESLFYMLLCIVK